MCRQMHPLLSCNSSRCAHLAYSPIADHLLNSTYTLRLCFKDLSWHMGYLESKLCPTSNLADGRG